MEEWGGSYSQDGGVLGGWLEGVGGGVGSLRLFSKLLCPGESSSDEMVMHSTTGLMCSLQLSKLTSTSSSDEMVMGSSEFTKAHSSIFLSGEEGGVELYTLTLLLRRLGGGGDFSRWGEHMAGSSSSSSVDSDCVLWAH